MSNTLSLTSQAKTGQWLSATIASITLITLVFAMIAVPPCGPYCQDNCIGYPYLDTLHLFPHDFLWIYLALFQLAVFIIFLAFLYLNSRDGQSIFTLPGLLFGTLAAGILIMTYYVQAAVLPVSLVKEEYDGLALLTMYNEHGIFIAREEIAYLLMSLSLFLFSWIFRKSGRKGLFLEWLFRLPLLASLMAILVLSLEHGLDRSYRFEVFTISFNWLVLIIGGYTMIGWLKLKNNK